MNTVSRTTPIGVTLFVLVAFFSQDAPGGTPSPPQSSPRVTEWPGKTTAERLFSLRPPYSYEDATKWLDAANVDMDVKEARGRNDHRLIGIMGYVLIAPGLKDRDPSNVPLGYRVVAIQGTSDSLEGRGQGRFQEKLLRFAERYNKGILAPRIE